MRKKQISALLLSFLILSSLAFVSQTRPQSSVSSINPNDAEGGEPPITDQDGDMIPDMHEFIFGDEAGHNNKITYQVMGRVDELNLQIPYNSDVLKTILQANKDMGGGKMLLSSMGLLKFEFSNEGTHSEYFMVRRAETDF